MVDKNICHNDTLQRFNEKLFSSVLTMENVTSKKRSIKVGDDKKYGYFFEKGRHTYFVEDIKEEEESLLDLLPITVNDKFETDYNKLCFFFVTDYTSVKIPDEQKLSFKELVDTVGNFKHTEPDNWLLYKIITIAARVDRINYRIVAPRGFGKDSIINIVNEFIGNISNIYGATFAKLEYSLKYKHLIFNEMGNLKAEDKYNMQQFLLAIGAFFNKYVKKSRATEDTQEEYDISKTSLGIIYNPPMDYVSKGQEFFDMMFTKAVANRFMPFYFDGLLDEKFDAQFDTDEVLAEYMDTLKDVVSTLKYFESAKVKNQFDIPEEAKFTEKTRRYERSFLKICDYISEYAKDCDMPEEMYNRLVYKLYDNHKRYDNLLIEALNFAGKEK